MPSLQIIQGHQLMHETPERLRRCNWGLLYMQFFVVGVGVWLTDYRRGPEDTLFVPRYQVYMIQTSVHPTIRCHRSFSALLTSQELIFNPEY